nr:shugoshin-1-like isoform X1 [Ipomoea batatas]
MPQLKVLEHELGCKSSLLKAMKLEAEVKPIKCEDTGDDLQEEEDKVDSELENAKRRRQSKSECNFWV